MIRNAEQSGQLAEDRTILEPTSVVPKIYDPGMPDEKITIEDDIEFEDK